MSERKYSEQYRLARIRRYAEQETEREKREAAREAAAIAASPDWSDEIRIFAEHDRDEAKF